MTRENRERQWLAYYTAAFSGLAFNGKLESFKSIFPEKPTEEQIAADAKLAATLMQNMKIAPGTPEISEARKVRLRALEAKRKNG